MGVTILVNIGYLHVKVYLLR